MYRSRKIFPVLERVAAPTSLIVGANDGGEKAKPLERGLTQEQKRKLEAPTVRLVGASKTGRPQTFMREEDSCDQ